MYSQAIGTTDETSVIYESERQIPVHFHLETEIAKTQQINCGPDLLQTLANLGDGMHFIGKIDFIGAGTYGAVSSVNTYSGGEIVWKVAKRPVPLDRLAEAACSEFTLNAVPKLIGDFSTKGRFTRTSMIPYAIDPPPPNVECMAGKQCFAILCNALQGKCKRPSRRTISFSSCYGTCAKYIGG